MARTDKLYSRFVATLKVVLPLAALVLLSTLFLLARVPEGGLPGLISGDLAADGRMRSSTFTADTEHGPLTVTAEAAIPREANYAVVDLEGLSAELQSADDRNVSLTAQSGRLLREAREVEFAGKVRVITSDGYTIKTEQMRSAFDGAWVEVPTDVMVQGPDFTLEAGAMTTSEASGGLAAGHMLFKKGVRLIYRTQPTVHEGQQ